MSSSMENSPPALQHGSLGDTGRSPCREDSDRWVLVDSCLASWLPGPPLGGDRGAVKESLTTPFEALSRSRSRAQGGGTGASGALPDQDISTGIDASRVPFALTAVGPSCPAGPTRVADVDLPFSVSLFG